MLSAQAGGSPSHLQVQPGAYPSQGFCRLHLREQANTSLTGTQPLTVMGKQPQGKLTLQLLCPSDLLGGRLRRLDGEEGVGKGEGSSGIPPAEILKIGEEGWRLPLKDELHLIPVSHDGALLSRS